jgi:hypothetical protein
LLIVFKSTFIEFLPQLVLKLFFEDLGFRLKSFFVISMFDFDDVLSYDEADLLGSAILMQNS